MSKFVYENLHIKSKIYKLDIDYIDSKIERDADNYSFKGNPPMQATYKTIVVKTMSFNEKTNCIEINAGMADETLSLPMTLEFGESARSTAELFWDENTVSDKVIAFNKGQRELMSQLMDKLAKIDSYYAKLVDPETHRKKEMATFKLV